MFEKSFNPILTELRYTEGNNKGQPTDKMKLNTIIFHTFVLMTLFNQINSRVIDAKQTNICRTLCNNGYFWMVMLFELIVQHFMLIAGNFPVGSALFGTAPLEPYQYGLCWCFALLTLCVNMIAKRIPRENFEFTAQFTLENERPNDKISKWVDSYQNAMKNSQAYAAQYQEDSDANYEGGIDFQSEDFHRMY